jgi:S-DNA-T family DNA segregation ATPase FtsK/SpoIIIE
LGVREVRVGADVDHAGRAQVLVVRWEALRRTAAPVDLSGRYGLDGLPVGVREDGAPWLLPLRGGHVLIAGATGAGKGSVLWSIIRALAPAIRVGLVEVWAADPKGGMELAFGQRLFARFGTDLPSIVDLLEAAVSAMQARTGRLRGRTRLHTPTPGDPLIVVVVDEIASLTAYALDRELRRRVSAALSVLLSQGRAPGVVVVGAVQDPRKDVVAFRDLFPVRVALRMTEAAQVDLVLGDGARQRGAHAETIPLSLPGVGYVLHETDPTPVRVRASWVDDGEIHRVAADYGAMPPTPTPVPAGVLPAVDGPAVHPGQGGGPFGLAGGWPPPTPGHPSPAAPMPPTPHPPSPHAPSAPVMPPGVPYVRPPAGRPPAAGGPVAGWVPDVDRYRSDDDGEITGPLRGVPLPPPAALPAGPPPAAFRSGAGPGPGARPSASSGGGRPGGDDDRAVWEAWAADYRRRHGLDEDGRPLPGRRRRDGPAGPGRF